MEAREGAGRSGSREPVAGPDDDSGSRRAGAAGLVDPGPPAAGAAGAAVEPAGAGVGPAGAGVGPAGAAVAPAIAAAPEADREPRVVLSPMDTAIERRVVTPARAAAAAALAAVLAFSVYAYVEYGLHRTLDVDPARLTTSTVSAGTFHEYIPLTGNVVPRTTVYLDAVEGGQVTEVYVEEGATVEAGQPLVKLKNTDLQLEVIGREAQLTEQLNNLSSTSLAFEQNRLQHKRELIQIDHEIDAASRHIAARRPLVGKGGATRAELDDLEADLVYQRSLRAAVQEAQGVDEKFQTAQIDRLRQALDAMNENLGIARQNLENLVVKAPIAGQLTLLEANVGESKPAGQRIGRIDELDAVKASAFVDEFYLTRVALGQTATVEIAGKDYALEIAKIYPDVRDRQFQIDLAFRGASPPGLRRGQTVRMRLEIGEPSETLVLANGAFYDDTGGRWVFALDPSGSYAERRDVRFGRRNPEGIEVLEGLHEGDRVITSSYESLEDFDRIQL
ncbi:MAG TPA: efflux RND transporter periplasmic adaptor subunit [Gammaproteobacteria bacterium]|nr:efflux RND transporter periplasmic adaptor subunit [Gammaproteobacteria bacterium]